MPVGIKSPLAGAFRPVEQPFLDVKADFPLVHLDQGAQLIDGKFQAFHFHDIYM